MSTTRKESSHYWGIFGKLKTAIDLYDDAESEMNVYDPTDIQDAILGPIDEKNKLSDCHKRLWSLFDSVDKNAPSEVWQNHLADEVLRNEFYDYLKAFANLLNVALTNRNVFVEVGLDLIEKYRNDYLFFNKLRYSVIERYDNYIDISKYESGIKNLLDTFVNATEIKRVVDPVYLFDETAMTKILESSASAVVKADKIKTRIESELKQMRYNDPLKFEEFSTKIKKTLAEYEQSRDADNYLAAMEIMADDLRNGRLKGDYPASISNDVDTKAFYGSIVTILRSENVLEITADKEEVIAQYARDIKLAISENAKRDWKHNEVVHKHIHRALDDCLFDMCDQIGLVIDKSNISIIDLMIEEIMKVALVRY